MRSVPYGGSLRMKSSFILEPSARFPLSCDREPGGPPLREALDEPARPPPVPAQRLARRRTPSRSRGRGSRRRPPSATAAREDAAAARRPASTPRPRCGRRDTPRRGRTSTTTTDPERTRPRSSSRPTGSRSSRAPTIAANEALDVAEPALGDRPQHAQQLDHLGVRQPVLDEEPSASTLDEAGLAQDLEVAGGVRDRERRLAAPATPRSAGPGPAPPGSRAAGAVGRLGDPRHELVDLLLEAALVHAAIQLLN